MTDDTRASCSPGPDQLRRRLAAIAEIGASGLTAHEIADDEHVLCFRADPATRRRLQDIVAAEAECCSFLDLSLSEEADAMVLSIAAPNDGQALADGLAAAFAASRAR
jgi:hypothetical protein